MEGKPGAGNSPIIRRYCDLVTQFLHIDIGLSQMNSEQLALRGRLWKTVNKATNEIIDGFLTELGN